MTDPVREATERLAAAGIDTPRLDARLLWQYAQQIDPPLEGGSNCEAIRGGDRPLDSDPSPKNPSDFSTLPQGEGEVHRRFDSFIARRLAREPVAYITGAKGFWTLELEVGPGVLVPRPDTETLIEQALRLYPREAPLAIADLGAGSGALLIAALSEFPAATGIGFESSTSAHAYAQRNLARLMPERGQILLADWTAASGPFDLVFCNPPYIPTADIDTLEPDVRDHEPRAALDGGPDGLDAYRALAKLLPRILKSGGHALLEIGAGQGPAAEPLFRPLEMSATVPDLAGIPRCLVLRAP